MILCQDEMAALWFPRISRMGILTGALEMTTFVIWQDLQSNSM
jgi:hypothetical protein